MSAVTSAGVADEREFRALVEPYRRALEIHCYRMLGSRHDAEDLVQETLLRAWRSFDRFEGRAAVSTWLYRIATNACLDEIERRPRRAEPVVDPYPDDRVAEAGAPIADPAARYALREGMELALLTAIQRLPGRQRAVLILRDVLGWSGPEVAELLETTVAAVNGALQRARATIDGAVPASSARNVRRDADRELLRKYVEAWERQDFATLVALLREDAVLTMPPHAAVRGATEIVAFFQSNCGGTAASLRATPGAANGRPAVLLHDGDGAPHRLLVLESSDGRAFEQIRAYEERELAAFRVGAQ